MGENRIKVRGNEEECECVWCTNTNTQDLAQGILGNDHFTNTTYTVQTHLRHDLPICKILGPGIELCIINT